MKRVIVALVLLAAAAGFCIVALSYQRTVMDDLQEQADAIHSALKDNRRDDCLALTRKFAEDCEKKTNAFLFFIEHGDVAPLVDTAAMLPILAEDGEEEQLLRALLECQGYLRKLSTQEMPSLENII